MRRRVQTHVESRRRASGAIVTAGAFIALTLTPASAVPASAASRVLGLPNLTAIVAAGGGAADFKTLKLLSAVGGPGVNAEVAGITAQFGVAAVKQFIATFDFSVTAALRRITAARDPLSQASADLEPPRALAAALYAAGHDRRHGGFRAQTMLDALLTPSLHAQINIEIGARYGPSANSNAMLIWERFMHDMQAAYAL